MIQTKCRQICEAPHSQVQSHKQSLLLTGSTSAQLLFPSGKELTFLASMGRKTWASQVGKRMAGQPGGEVDGGPARWGSGWQPIQVDQSGLLWV